MPHTNNTISEVTRKFILWKWCTIGTDNDWFKKEKCNKLYQEYKKASEKKNNNQ